VGVCEQSLPFMSVCRKREREREREREGLGRELFLYQRKIIIESGRANLPRLNADFDFGNHYSD
jgi:hypothetical protein